jgi:hypothetical protein
MFSEMLREARRPPAGKTKSVTKLDHALDPIEDDGAVGITPPPPCSECGSLDLWESPIMPHGFTWRCLRCDPPIRAWQWLKKSIQLRASSTNAD